MGVGLSGYIHPSIDLTVHRNANIIHGIFHKKNNLLLQQARYEKATFFKQRGRTAK
jgi:hypothetical protein